MIELLYLSEEFATARFHTEIGDEPRRVWKTGVQEPGEPEGSPTRPAIKRFAGTKKAPANLGALLRLY
jgi:hypothetical protein